MNIWLSPRGKPGGSVPSDPGRGSGETLEQSENHVRACIHPMSWTRYGPGLGPLLERLWRSGEVWGSKTDPIRSRWENQCVSIRFEVPYSKWRVLSTYFFFSAQQSPRCHPCPASVICITYVNLVVTTNHDDWILWVFSEAKKNTELFGNFSLETDLITGVAVAVRESGARWRSGGLWNQMSTFTII